MLRKLCVNSLLAQNKRTSSFLVNQPPICESNCVQSLKWAFSIPKTQNSFYSTTKRTGLLIENKIKKSTDATQQILELEKILRCSWDESNKVYEYLSNHSGHLDIDSIRKIVRWLHRMGATYPIILKNSQILLMPLDCLRRTYERLGRSKWKQTDDFLPLLVLDDSKIEVLQRHNRHVIRDRIYLFHEYFSIEPYIISQSCAKHLFVFEIELELLKRKLDMLNNSSISPENILRDLNLLARGEDVIRERLEYIKMCGIQRVMPWMIKCEYHVLNRSVEIRNQRGSEQNKTLELLAKRLDWHGKTVISMHVKNKFLHQLNYDTASELLDELLKIFSPSEITANISLLSHSVSHVKIRVAELLALNNPSISPRVLNLSEKKFYQFLDNVKNK